MLRSRETNTSKPSFIEFFGAICILLFVGALLYTKFMELSSEMVEGVQNWMQAYEFVPCFVFVICVIAMLWMGIKVMYLLKRFWKRRNKLDLLWKVMTPVGAVFILSYSFSPVLFDYVQFIRGLLNSDWLTFRLAIVAVILFWILAPFVLILAIGLCVIGMMFGLFLLPFWAFLPNLHRSRFWCFHCWGGN